MKTKSKRELHQQFFNGLPKAGRLEVLSHGAGGYSLQLILRYLGGSAHQRPPAGSQGFERRASPAGATACLCRSPL
jgi:hypothetical protein